MPAKLPELPRDRVARLIRERIADGTYPPGSQLPPMDDLAAELEVSRGTVAAVLRTMPEVRVIPGYGSFVVGKPTSTALAAIRSCERSKSFQRGSVGGVPRQERNTDAARDEKGTFRESQSTARSR